MLLLPAGVPWFAQRLLNQMHYVRDQHVIASCLALFATYVVLAGVVVLAMRLARRRWLTLLVVATCVLPLVAGCDDGSAGAGAAEVLGEIGSTGRGDGEFLYPRAIDIGADGTVYVIDKTGRVQRLRDDGSVVNILRIPKTEAGYPTGITVGPEGNIYVADTHYHRVLVFSPEGRLLRQFGRFGQGDGCFIYPTDVAFAPDGRIFVSEYGGNDRISVYSAAGRFLSSFGTPGEGEGELSRPSAIQVDAKRGVLYVADACNHRIARYDLAGGLLGYIGRPGREAGELRYPYDLALAPDGKIVVCEYGNNRVQVFDASGESLAVYGSAGRRLGQLAYPWGVALGPAGRVFVIDAGNNRLQIWRLGALR
jgi:DNA-binding beta-propeller fold protein YncE